MSDQPVKQPGCTCGVGYDPECPWEGHHQPEPVKRYSPEWKRGLMAMKKVHIVEAFEECLKNKDRDIKTLEDEVGRLRGVVSRMVKRSDYNDQAETLEALRKKSDHDTLQSTGQRDNGERNPPRRLSTG